MAVIDVVGVLIVNDIHQKLGNSRTLYNKHRNAICCEFPLWLLISHVSSAGGSMITIRCAVIVAGVPMSASFGTPWRGLGF